MNARNELGFASRYQSGFGNSFETEAIPSALPRGRNSPQKVPFGLYAEQLSGSAFTAPRTENQRSWLYRLRPAVGHPPFERLPHAGLPSAGELAEPSNPSQLRWSPPAVPSAPTDFVAGLAAYATCGGPRSHAGGTAFIYTANRSMSRYLYSADGDFLILPQDGSLCICTELGVLDLAPGEVAVIPRGIRFRVELRGATARGYACENFGRPFVLPDLGPIGANGLANPRDFLTPVAAFEDVAGEFELVAKFDGALWRTTLAHSPLDVVAWHGNYAPYKYDLARFNTINTVSFDHPDPSIFTVLTSPSGTPGTANIDFVIFPPRWMVAEGTFRPPYFHRNVMSEFMGLIHGVYDAKEDGFLPGGASLHNAMTAHGPDAATWRKAEAAPLAPARIDDTLAFMFETSLVWHPTSYATGCPHLQRDYWRCWSGFASNFKT